MTGRRRPPIGLIGLLAVDAFGAWAAVSAGFVSTGTAVRVATTLAAAVSVVIGFRLIPATHPPAASPFEQALRPRPERPVAPPATLERIRRTTVLSVTAAGNLHYRLRPVLRDIAVHRLRVNHRLDLDTQPDEARARLGDLAYGLVRADLPRPEDRLAPGISTADLATVVDALEEL